MCPVLVHYGYVRQDVSVEFRWVSKPWYVHKKFIGALEKGLYVTNQQSQNRIMPPSIPTLLGGKGTVVQYMIFRVPVSTLRHKSEEDFPHRCRLEFMARLLSKALCAKL